MKGLLKTEAQNVEVAAFTICACVLYTLAAQRSLASIKHHAVRRILVEMAVESQSFKASLSIDESYSLYAVVVFICR